jgi:hypothetical protein
MARRMLEADAERILDAARADDPPTWTSRAFASRVQAARDQLAPIGRRAALVESLRREAGHGSRADASGSGRPGWQAVRVAYAIRWVELASGTVLPAWKAWTGLPGPQG